MGRKDNFVIYYGIVADLRGSNKPTLILHDLSIGQSVGVKVRDKSKRPTCALALSLQDYYLGYSRYIDHHHHHHHAVNQRVQRISVESEPIALYQKVWFGT
jgi:hypothetical protein